MKQYLVTGMSCAACANRVEKAVSKVEGVVSCSVSLLTNSMGVEGTAPDNDIIKAVVDAGYGASVKENAVKSEAKANSESEEETLADKETPVLVRRLVASLEAIYPVKVPQWKAASLLFFFRSGIMWDKKLFFHIEVTH